MSGPDRDREPPADIEPAPPETPQTSIHAQTVQPEAAKSDAPAEPGERTMEEEALRREHSAEEGGATERRRDET